MTGLFLMLLKEAAMPTPRPDDPDHLAGWDRDRDGRMADHAAPDDAVVTVPYDIDEDDD